MPTRAAARMLSTGKKIEKIGLIGLGAMGLPMLDNFLAAGYTMKAFDVNSASVDAAVAKGATGAASPGEAATDVDAIVTMVPNDRVLKEITYAADTGILQALREGAVLSLIHI